MRPYEGVQRRSTCTSYWERKKCGNLELSFVVFFLAKGYAACLSWSSLHDLMGQKKGHPIHLPHFFYICLQTVLLLFMNPQAVYILTCQSSETALVPKGVRMGHRLLEEPTFRRRHFTDTKQQPAPILHLTGTHSSRGNTLALYFLTILTLNQMVSLLLRKRKQLLIKKLFK